MDARAYPTWDEISEAAVLSELCDRELASFARYRRRHRERISATPRNAQLRASQRHDDKRGEQRASRRKADVTLASASCPMNAEADELPSVVNPPRRRTASVGRRGSGSDLRQHVGGDTVPRRHGGPHGRRGRVDDLLTLHGGERALRVPGGGHRLRGPRRNGPEVVCDAWPSGRDNFSRFKMTGIGLRAPEPRRSERPLPRERAEASRPPPSCVSCALSRRKRMP